MLTQVAPKQWERLSELIARTMGLHFPPERWNDLQRGMIGAAEEFGFDNVAACITWLLASAPSRAQLEVLASHLTIGETYFFRDRDTLDALVNDVLRKLIDRRRGGLQRLRLWSAACCSGEEAYSMAILVHQLLPDLDDWHVRITATDINPRFLRKAAAGVYGEWSFRNAPVRLKQRYFTPLADGRWAIVPEIRKLVSFAPLNLVEDAYPSHTTETHAMDVILCRNVLMYFTPQQINKVIGGLHRSLVPGGVLAVSPSEVSQALFSRFETVSLPGATLYRKGPENDQITPHDLVASPIRPAGVDIPPLAGAASRNLPLPVGTAPEPAARAPGGLPQAGSNAALASADTLYRAGRHEEAIATLLPTVARDPVEPAACALLARAHANQGRHADALHWSGRWTDAAKLDPAAHYVRAMVLLELGDPEQARASLHRALYLDQDFVLAHFSLGNLARSRGRLAEATRHFTTALGLVQRCAPETILPESDGVTAGRFVKTLTLMIDSRPSR